MEIKNLNIFNTESTANLNSKKKKLHKKTISCLLQPPKELKKKLPEPSENIKPLIKHKKTKSQ